MSLVETKEHVWLACLPISKDPWWTSSDFFYAERAKKVPDLFTFVMKFKTASLLDVLEQSRKNKSCKANIFVSLRTIFFVRFLLL